MDIKITPAPLKGIIKSIPSKSHLHRLLICNRLAGGDCSFLTTHVSSDIDATVSCLQALTDPNPLLDCGESGSTLRFMLPVVAALKDRALFCGSGRLPERPISPLKEEMESHGCTFSPDTGDIELPLQRKHITTVKGKLTPGTFYLPGNVSSQYITGLLLALPILNGDSTVVITSPMESESYLDITLKVLKDFDISVTKEDDIYHIKGNQCYRFPSNLSPEGDWSNSAFWLVAGALGGKVSCTGLDTASPQGDKAILYLLEKAGAVAVVNGDTVTVKEGPLKALEIDGSQIPDLIPILSVLASVSSGTTVISNAARLRIKESDRLKSTYLLLSSLGADIFPRPDGLVIKGKKALDGGLADSFNDHRIAMSAAIASTVCRGPLTIKNAEAVNKSYPDFFEDFRQLGGTAYEIHNR